MSKQLAVKRYPVDEVIDLQLSGISLRQELINQAESEFLDRVDPFWSVVELEGEEFVVTVYGVE